MPWDSKQKAAAKATATIGAVVCYKLKSASEDSDEKWEAEKVWQKGYGSQTGCLHWSQNENTLYIGFDDGSIQRLKITEQNHATEVSLFAQ